MNIVLVSTVGHNPGDEFIRLGQQHLLQRLVSDTEFSVVHKHDPRTLFEDSVPRGSPHRLLAPLLHRVHSALTSARNRLSVADLVVFAGTPFIWRQDTWLLPSTSANAEWTAPIWGALVHEYRDVPVLNLAAGTSLNPRQDLGFILKDRRVVAFLDSALRRASLTTARDQTTARILERIGHSVPVLPCTSLWAAHGARLERTPQEYVALNVMREGVHRARGKATAGPTWRDTIRAVVEQLSLRWPLRFICHSPEELRLARTWFPSHPAIYSRDPVVLLDAYGRARYTVSNRVHGAAGAASFGRPALGIGGDSRMELLQEFGLPTMDVAAATAGAILDACERMEAGYGAITEQLRRLARSQERRYLDLLTAALPKV